MRAKIVMVVHTIIMMWWATYLSYRFLYFPKNYLPLRTIDVATIVIFVISNVVFERNCKKSGAWTVVRLFAFFLPIVVVVIAQGRG